MLTSFKQSFQALTANPARTGLTTLGIIIGISTVVLVLSAGAGFRSLIDAQVETLGSNTLFVETRVPPTTKNRASNSIAQADTSRVGNAVAVTTFKNRDLNDILHLNNVVNDYGMVVGQQVASFGNVSKSAMFYGASAARFAIDKSTLKSGRFYTAAEDAGADQVAILGSNLANDLFGQDDPLGKLIRLGNLNFQVIGVYNPQGALGGGNDDMLYLPLKTAQKKLMGIDYILVGVIQVKDTSLGDATAEDIRTLLRRNHNITDPAKDDFIVQTQAQSLSTFNTIFSGLTILLIAISAISLLVGGVGIMNIMYVVVTERTAEIGLKKAVGATNSAILSEFLIEAILITLVGGVVGVLWGSFLGFVVAKIAESAHLAWQFQVPGSAIALALGVSGAIGIIFGVLPARSASRLDPIKALTHE